MTNTQSIYQQNQLLRLDVSGDLELTNCIRAVENLVSNPEFHSGAEILVDLTQAQSSLTFIDVFELAKYLTSSTIGLRKSRRVAVLASECAAYDHAEFLALCSQNRGLLLQAFGDKDDAISWLRD